MKTNQFTFKTNDGLDMNTYCFMPEEKEVVGVVQIIHGMVETAARYERFAKALTDEGYIVYANDLRGHGLTAGDPEKVGFLAEEDGFDWIIKDCHQLTEMIQKEHPDLPLFLFGHSMGSYASQRYIQLYGKDLKGVILSGSSGSSPLFTIGKLVAKNEMKRKGKHARSPFLNSMAFGSYNKHFKPQRTDFDWLSRDEAEVDKYIADPYCGLICTTEFYYDFMKGLGDIFQKENVNLVPRSLPIFIVSGTKDPVGDYGKGVKKLANMYRDLGIQDVQMKLYEDARHEILNETNRDEVTSDIIDWIKRHNQKGD